MAVISEVLHVPGSGTIEDYAPGVAGPLRTPVVSSRFCQAAEARAVSADYVDGSRLQQFPTWCVPPWFDVAAGARPLGRENDPLAIRRKRSIVIEARRC